MIRLNLKSDDVINCQETTFVKERNRQFGIKQGLLFENPNIPKNLQQVKKCYKSIQTSKW